MLNLCQFIGNLGRDPEVRVMQSGDKVVSLRLAVSERWKDKSGERRERTEWVSIVIFSQPLARIAEQYLRKGSRLYASGQLETRKWQDKSGADRYSTEVVLRPYRGDLTLLDGKSDGRRDEGGHDERGSYGGPSGDGSVFEDSEIPF